jgi:hypothetical protein
MTSGRNRTVKDGVFVNPLKSNRPPEPISASRWLAFEVARDRQATWRCWRPPSAPATHAASGE